MMLPGKSVLPAIVAIGGIAFVIFGIWWAFFATYHLATVQTGVLYRDGNRSMRQFRAAARRAKFKTVVALVDDREITHEPFTDELAYCREQGIEVVRIPIPLGGWPQGDQVRQFLSVATNPSRQPVLVHCAQGVRRTGMMVAAFQESVLKMTPQQAKDAMLTFGHSQRTVGDVQRFIDVYDPVAETMTQEFEISKE